MRQAAGLTEGWQEVAKDPTDDNGETFDRALSVAGTIAHLRYAMGNLCHVIHIFETGHKSRCILSITNSMCMRDIENLIVNIRKDAHYIHMEWISDG
jgi:hypothetical protein